MYVVLAQVLAQTVVELSRAEFGEPEQTHSFAGHCGKKDFCSFPLGMDALCCGFVSGPRRSHTAAGEHKQSSAIIFYSLLDNCARIEHAAPDTAFIGIACIPVYFLMIGVCAIPRSSRRTMHANSRLCDPTIRTTQTLSSTDTSACHWRTRPKRRPRAPPQSAENLSRPAHRRAPLEPSW